MGTDIQGFSLRLQKRAADLGFSPTYIANELKISLTAVLNWFNARSFPRPEALTKLADLLEVDVQWLKWGPEYRIPPIVLPTSEENGEIKLSVEVQKTIEILESKSIYATALMGNINAFHDALQNNKNNDELEERIKDIESHVKQCKGRDIFNRVGERRIKDLGPPDGMAERRKGNKQPDM